jgi:hypothetical protein
MVEGRDESLSSTIECGVLEAAGLAGVPAYAPFSLILLAAES